MRCNIQLTTTACLLAAHSVQAGPLRWKRALWERDEVSTPGELPTLPPTTLPTATADPTSIPSTTTIIDSTPLTTTIEPETSTTRSTADRESGTGSAEASFPSDETPRPIFSTVTSGVTDGLQSELTSLLMTGERSASTTSQFTMPAPNPTSVEVQPLPDDLTLLPTTGTTPTTTFQTAITSSNTPSGTPSSSFETSSLTSITRSEAPVETPRSSLETTLLRSTSRSEAPVETPRSSLETTLLRSTTRSEDLVNTPRSSLVTTPASTTRSKAPIETPRSSLETPSSSDLTIRPTSLSSQLPLIPSPTKIITTTIIPQEPPQTPLPDPNGTMPGAGSPSGAQSSGLPMESSRPETTASTTFASAPTDTPRFRTQPHPQQSSTSLAETTSSTSATQNPTLPSQAPPSLPQTTQESSTTKNELVQPAPTSRVLTQTIGEPDTPKETTSVMPELPSSSSSSSSSTTTKAAEPATTTTTTIKQSQTQTITQSPNPAIPTAEIQTTTISVSPSLWDANLARARGYNKIYDTLSPDMACSAGQVACVSGKVGQCAFGTFDLNSCQEGSRCFALPSETADGVVVSCFDVEHAEAVLRGEKGPASQKTTTTSAEARPTRVIRPAPSDEQASQPAVVQPTTTTTSTTTTSRSTSSVVVAKPTTTAPPAAPLINTYFPGETQFTKIFPVNSDGDLLPPAPRPTDVDSGGRADSIADAGDDGSSNRVTQTVNGTPTVSVTVTVTVASTTITQAGVTKTVTQKETETVTVGRNGDRVDTVSIGN